MAHGIGVCALQDARGLPAHTHIAWGKAICEIADLVTIYGNLSVRLASIASG